MDVAMITRKGNLFWIACVVFWMGCAQWSSPPPGGLDRLPLPKLAPDSVVLEVTFVRVPAQREDFETRFWPEVDEQLLAGELRRALATNGFRCGVLGTPPPVALQEVLDQQDFTSAENGETIIDPSAAIVARTRRLRSRAGQPGKIIVSHNPIAKLAALTRDEDGYVHGQSLDQAQSYFSITSHPTGDGQVNVELVPIIEHGQPRSRFVGQQGAWSIDNTSRSTESFKDLKIQATLAPGQAVVVASTSPPRGLGEQFFAQASGDTATRMLLLVRVQQTQLDDRFDQEASIDSVTALD
jgi:hypothetical protein